MRGTKQALKKQPNMLAVFSSSDQQALLEAEVRRFSSQNPAGSWDAFKALSLFAKDVDRIRGAGASQGVFERILAADSAGRT